LGETLPYGPGARRRDLPAAAATRGLFSTNVRARRKAAKSKRSRNRAYGAELGMRREQDAADGYRTMTVSRAIAGFKKMGRSGVIITAFTRLRIVSVDWPMPATTMR